MSEEEKKPRGRPVVREIPDDYRKLAPKLTREAAKALWKVHNNTLNRWERVTHVRCMRMVTGTGRIPRPGGFNEQCQKLSPKELGELFQASVYLIDRWLIEAHNEGIESARARRRIMVERRRKAQGKGKKKAWRVDATKARMIAAQVLASAGSGSGTSPTAIPGAADPGDTGSASDPAGT